MVEGTSVFNKDNEKIGVREREGIDKFFIVGCGIGMAERKGIDLFVDIYFQLKEIRQDFIMYWIGTFEETIEYILLKERIQDEKNIQILGFIDNPISLINAADLFILPSREDPFPLVCLEAAQCGVPIICFQDCGGIPEIIENCGLTIPKFDTTLFAESISNLIGNSVLDVYSKNIIEISKNYTIEVTAPKILKLISSYSSARSTVKNEITKVHIILPNYNHGKYLEKRVTSILEQTYTNWELTVLDDCSTDNSMEIINKYGLKYIRNGINSGSTFKQWVKGLDLIEEGEIVWIAESDDYSHPEFLANLVPYFYDPEVSLVYCDSFVVNSDNEIIGNYLETDYLKSISSDKWNNDYKLNGKEELFQCLGIKNTILNASSMLFRKNDFSNIRTDLLNMKLAGDWLFEINLVLEKKTVYSSKRHNYHRRHEESVIGKNVDVEKKYLTLFQEMKKVHKFVLQNIDFSYDFYKRMFAYVHQQYLDLNLKNDISYYYPIKVGFMGMKEVQIETSYKNFDLVLKNCGNNTGNLLFSETAKTEGRSTRPAWAGRAARHRRDERHRRGCRRHRVEAGWRRCSSRAACRSTSAR